MQEHSIAGVRIHDLSLSELEILLRSWLVGDTPHRIVTPNPEFVLSAGRDGVFRERLNRADLSLPDGVGLRFAVAALTNARLKNRHTGVDTLILLALLCQQNGKRLALVGGSPGSAIAAAQRLRDRFSGLDVIGIDPGMIVEDTSSEPPTGTSMLISVQPAVLAVGLGEGKQEWFLEKVMLHVPSMRIGIGVGGSFETIGGFLPRAPLRMRQLGLEWMWRLWIEPHRFGRIYRATIVFPAVVLWDTLKRRRFLKAIPAVCSELLTQMKGL